MLPKKFSKGYVLITALAAALYIATPSNYTVGLPAVAVLSKVAVGLVYGFILGFVRLKARNCYATVLLHGIMNLFAF